jgi:hypothetical protein
MFRLIYNEKRKAVVIDLPSDNTSVEKERKREKKVMLITISWLKGK